MKKDQIKENAQMFIGSMFNGKLGIGAPANVNTIAEKMADHLFGMDHVSEAQMAGAFKSVIESI